MNWTGERLETFIYSRDSIEHLHRYSILSEYIKDKVVLDIACGEGYGSNIISNFAKYVIGVDIDEETIKTARTKYKSDKISFKIGRADSIPQEDNSVDLVVSFETLEHHDKHFEMLSEIKRVLKVNGILIISTPDKFFYSDKRNFKNTFHFKELYKQEFQDLIASNFTKIQYLTQQYVNGCSLIEDINNSNKTEIHTGNYSEVFQQKIDPLYLIAIASDFDFKIQSSSLFDGSQVTKAEFKNQIDEVFKSKSYILGNFILKPFKFFKRVMK